MNILDIIRLLLRYFYWIAGSALVLSLLVYYATKDDKKLYATHTLLNTGLISGYSIENSSSGRLDYAKTNNELENLINLATAYETNKELSARLMAHFIWSHQLEKLRLLPGNIRHFEETMEHIELSLTPEDTEITIYEKILALRESSQDNEIYLISNSKNDFFGIEQLRKIKVMREGNSDMIRMEYTSLDPYLSQKTLEFLTDIFMLRQQNIKSGQSESVIEFFEEALDKSSDRLKKAEDDLLNFRVSNKIINYYEQTRFISGNKEEIDKQYQGELKVQAGAISALQKLEFEISDKNILASLQDQLAENRKQIASYSSALASLDLLTENTEYGVESKLQQQNLQLQSDSLKRQMSEITQRIIRANQTTDGVATKDLLTQWLNFTIVKEESSAKLAIIETRQKEYAKIYEQYAPLGSTLKKLEREIDVAEREFLENLHSFNQARLHKYSMMMSTNIKVIDPPYYPIKPEASKRLFMVILAFLVGGILPAALLIIFELTDRSLRNPENAMLQTGLRLGGLLPKNTPKDRKKYDIEILQRQSLNLFMQELRANSKGDKQPKKVIIFSTIAGEGKSYLLETLAKNFQGFQDHKNAEFSFIELEPILHHPYDQQQLADGDIHVLVTRANRKWTTADKHALKVYQKLSGKKPLLFLNGVSVDVMEEVIGEIPKHRNWLRAKVKLWMTQGLKPSGL